MGMEGIFAMVLMDLACSSQPAYQSDGMIVPMPEKTSGEWKESACLYLKLARLALASAGLRDEPPTSETLFDEYEKLRVLAGGAA
jgi:hypothetical protein